MPSFPQDGISGTHLSSCQLFLKLATLEKSITLRLTQQELEAYLWGKPLQGRADYPFFQQLLKNRAPYTGRCAILFPMAFSSAKKKPKCARSWLNPI
jgi:hypothetical protein